jgi:hypothetical protein
METLQPVWEDGSAVEGPQFYEDGQMNAKTTALDARLIVTFMPRVVRNNFKSIAVGRPVHDTFDFIQIIVPGDRLRVVEREASDYDKSRFAAKWALYKAGKKEEVTGTLLSSWGVMAPNIAADYFAMNVKTVEQLAEADELLITNLGMGARDWKQRAQAYLAATGKSTTLLDEITALKARLAAVEKEEKAAPAAPATPPANATQAAIAAVKTGAPPFTVPK